MDGLFSGQWSFGPNYLDPFTDAAMLVRLSASRRSGLRVQVRQQCPRRPGVYGMVSRNGELIYVGKAKCLRARLLSYFRKKSRDPKAGRILGQTEVIVAENAPSEFAALLRELELIRRWRPRFNVHGQPGRRRPLYLCLGRQPAAHTFLSRLPPAATAAAFGPIPAGRSARDAVRYLNDWFRLRDCPRAQQMVFAEQTELFPVARTAGCLRYEIGTCLGPCLGACSRAEYMDRVRAARCFLAGTDLTLLEQLEAAMSQASSELAFERAARLRDQLQRLRWLHERLDRLRLASAQPAFVYPVAGWGGKDIWYLIHRGMVVASVRAPRTFAEREAAAKTIDAALGQKRTVPAGEMENVFLVAAWFRRHPEAHARILPAKNISQPPAYLEATPQAEP